jgi:hypothetical protein
VILRVLRKDTVEVPAGTFSTVVVQPIIRSSGAFGEGGKAELYFSDDERRLLVLMNSDVPVIGRLSLQLKAIKEGSPLPTGGEARPEENPAGLKPGSELKPGPGQEPDPGLERGPGLERDPVSGCDPGLGQ